MGATGIGRDHDNYEDLLGAYALDAVTPEERQALEAHVATCSTCRAELARLRVAVHALPLALEEREPSPALRDRIEAAVRRDLAGELRPAGADRAVVALPGPEPAGSAWRPSPRLGPRRMVGNPWAVAAALLLMFSLGMLLWNVRLQQSLRREGTVETVAVQPTDPASGVDGHLTYLEDRGVAILSVRDLPPLAPEQVYEVWLIGDEDEPVPAGVFDEPATDYAVAVDRRRYQALAITVEPGPLGSPRPTSQPFVVAPLPAG